MCQKPEARVQADFLAAVRTRPNPVVFDLYDVLREKGVCLLHFLDALMSLSRAGRIRSKDPSHPIDTALMPDHLLRVRLEFLEDPVPGGEPDRILPEGFTIFTGQVLGRGGVGVVYRGEQVRLKRPVAIKVMKLRQLPDGISADWFTERFRREPRVIASLNHPHVVQVIDCGEDGDELWYAMEFLEGGTLSDRIRLEGRLRPDEVRAYFRAVAGALGEAAQHGVMHRDVKPGNIFNRGIKLADFGLAKVAPSPGEEGIPGKDTHVRAVLGTMAYLSPERAACKPADARADMYSLGATIYHAATGHYLFDHGPDNRRAWIYSHLHSAPVPVSEHVPGFPPDLASAIHRCLAKDPNERFATFEALVAELSR